MPVWTVLSSKLGVGLDGSGEYPWATDLKGRLVCPHGIGGIHLLSQLLACLCWVQ